ncbi:MAG: hypothetical protein KDK25_11305 [Leptospiraceae bacterium]|nr:hypothetical protein [Leptospiraceae bacterium]
MMAGYFLKGSGIGPGILDSLRRMDSVCSSHALLSPFALAGQTSIAGSTSAFIKQWRRSE